MLFFDRDVFNVDTFDVAFASVVIVDGGVVVAVVDFVFGVVVTLVVVVLVAVAVVVIVVSVGNDWLVMLLFLTLSLYVTISNVEATRMGKARSQ